MLNGNAVQPLVSSTAIFILSVNVTTFNSNIFRLVRKSSLIKFDPFRTDLIQKKIKNKTAILILSVNATSNASAVSDIAHKKLVISVKRKYIAFRFFREIATFSYKILSFDIGGGAGGPNIEEVD